MLVVGVRSCGRDLEEGGGKRETRRDQVFFGFGFRKGAEQMENFRQNVLCFLGFLIFWFFFLKKNKWRLTWQRREAYQVLKISSAQRAWNPKYFGFNIEKLKMVKMSFGFHNIQISPSQNLTFPIFSFVLAVKVTCSAIYAKTLLPLTLLQFLQEKSNFKTKQISQESSWKLQCCFREAYDIQIQPLYVTASVLTRRL